MRDMATLPRPRELLTELGLISLEPEDANEVLRLFESLLDARIVVRLKGTIGAAAFQELERMKGLQDSEESRRRGLEILQRSLPDFPQHFSQELENLKAEFVQRLAERTHRQP